MTELRVLERYCNRLLCVDGFDDYCANGLQVDAGVVQVERLVTGVTACQALLEAAVARGADLLLVHHGYFWKGEPQPLVGPKGRRVRTLMVNGISLMAYHLPLDAHGELGNNRCLADRLGLRSATPLEGEQGLIWAGELETALEPALFHDRLSSTLERKPLHIDGGVERIQRIGWCTGAAQGYIEHAAAAGLDAFVSGEISEQTTHLARELGIHYFAAGHHATERFGVQALGAHLAAEFGLQHTFVDIPNPV